MEPILSKDELISIVNRGDVELVEGCTLYRHQEDITLTNFKGKSVTPAATGAAIVEGGDNVAGTKKKRSKKRKAT